MDRKTIKTYAEAATVTEMDGVTYAILDPLTPNVNVADAVAEKLLGPRYRFSHEANGSAIYYRV